MFELPVSPICGILYFKRAGVSISIISSYEAHNCERNISPLLKFPQSLPDNSGCYMMLTINIHPHDVTMEFHVHPMAEHVTVVVVSPSSNRCPPKSHA